MTFPALTAAAVRELSDLALLDAQRSLAAQRRAVDAQAAVVAAEVAHRSRHELGHDGLAQRMGARTPEKLVQQVTGASAHDAGAMVRVGALPPDSPLSVAVGSGGLGLDAADAINAGLGEGAPVDAVLALIASATELSVEKLAARAREVKAELDEDGIADRERYLRDRRFLRLSPNGDGMTRLSGLLDPESAAVVVAAYDGATSPRLGGPRFVDPDSVAATDELLRDERTTEQLAVDAFVELIRLGGEADTKVLPARRPAVRVLVAERDLARRSGAGQLEGQTTAISIDTVERHACETGIVPVIFDLSGRIIDVGREQRLYTARQRIGLAARDGGCRFPGCDRPPSWCEAHHIVAWSHGGRTDLADGILLCRHHHLLVHNNGWRVERSGANYALIPPRSLDPAQVPIPAPAKSPVARRLLGVL
ncbi:MAG TPA: DUF222 domain-containing protein [Pseudolysinimonas sp.]|jgi:hypothetical protein